MQLEIKTEGVDFVVSCAPAPKNDADGRQKFVVSCAPAPKNDADGRQKADRKTGEPLFTTELVAMDDTGAEVIKVTTAGEPKVVKRQGVAVRRLVATPWNADGRGGVAFRADAIAPFTAPPSAGGMKAGASAGAGS